MDYKKKSEEVLSKVAFDSARGLDQDSLTLIIQDALDQAHRKGMEEMGNINYELAACDYRQMMLCGWTLQEIWAFHFKVMLIDHKIRPVSESKRARAEPAQDSGTKESGDFVTKTTHKV